MEIMKIITLTLMMLCLILDITLLIMLITWKPKKEKQTIEKLNKKRYTKKDEKRIKAELWKKYISNENKEIK